jgi:ribosome maturation factor RimP
VLRNRRGNKKFPFLLISTLNLEAKDIQQIVNKYFDKNSIEDCFYVDTKISGKKIEVFLDRDGGISFDICRKISRLLEEIFDEKLPFGESYTLDVSSPGVGSPLKLPRQYVNNIGRQIEVKFGEVKLKGKLKDANLESCTVEEETTVIESKKKKIVMVDHVIKYVDIIEAKIKISF